MTILQLLTEALADLRASSGFRSFKRDNKNLAPLVEAYLDGGPRPTDAQLGANRYAQAVVGFEDARRLAAVVPTPEEPPEVPPEFDIFDVVVTYGGQLVPTTETGTFRGNTFFVRP